jgi:hypothetical protein
MDRRKFIKSTGAGVAATSVAPWLTLAPPRPGASKQAKPAAPHTETYAAGQRPRSGIAHGGIGAGRATACLPPYRRSDLKGRTGTGTLSVFGYQMQMDLNEGFPLLTMMVAQVCGLRPGTFVHTFGDVHLYLNHIEQAELQLSRQPRPLPTMAINPTVQDLFGFRYEDFELQGYDPHPAIRAQVAV